MSRRPGARWVLAGLFVLSLPLVNPYLRGDGNGYYAYVRSAVIDGDLDFENEFRRADPLFRDIYFDERGDLRPSMRAATGRAINQWAVGPAILWLPFFLAAHVVVALANLLSAGVPADGFSAPYRWLCAIGTACYGWLAIMLGHAIAARVTGARAAILGALAMWWASSLPVYMYFLPFHVHGLSAFAVALFVWYWLRTRPFGLATRAWAVWGLMAGLMIDVYYLNGLFMLLAAVELVGGRRHTDPARAPATIAAAAAFAAGALVAMAPHVFVKWIVHGSPLATGYRDQFFWTTPRLWQVGFSSEHGLFVWTPVVLLAVIGLIVLARRDARAAGPLLAAFALFYYAVASYQNWHGQSSFGNRFFVSFTPAFVLGAAIAVEAAERALARANVLRPLVPAALALLVAWNVGFAFQWGANLVPNRGPVSFAAVARNQVTVVPRRLAGFAWRYLVDRRGLTSETEEQDRLEHKGYELKR